MNEPFALYNIIWVRFYILCTSSDLTLFSFSSKRHDLKKIHTRIYLWLVVYLYAARQYIDRPAEENVEGR